MSLIPIPKPFHETILFYLKRISLGITTSGEAGRILDLIKNTKIPRDHDKLIEALDEFNRISNVYVSDKVEEVKIHILTQKAECEKRAKEGVNLDELETEVRKMLGLLEDRHPDLSTWNDAMRGSMTKLRSLTGKAFG